MNKFIILGCGYIGTNVANFIEKYPSTEVTVIGMKNEYVNYLAPNVKFYDATIEKISDADKPLFEDAIVIDAVGNTNATNSALESSTLFLQNCMDKVKFLNVLCSLNIAKYIFLSSGGTVYNDSNVLHKEDEKLEPKSVYALEKITIEKYLSILSLENSKFKYLILRISNPYGGISSKHRKQGIIDVAINKIKNNEILEFYGDLENVRDYIHIDNVAEYIYKISISDEKNEIFNIGSGCGVSVKDILGSLEEVYDKKINLKTVESNTVNIKKNILNVEKIKGKVSLESEKTLKGFFNLCK